MWLMLLVELFLRLLGVRVCDAASVQWSTVLPELSGIRFFLCQSTVKVVAIAGDRVGKQLGFHCSCLHECPILVLLGFRVGGAVACATLVVGTARFVPCPQARASGAVGLTT